MQGSVESIEANQLDLKKSIHYLTRYVGLKTPVLIGLGKYSMRRSSRFNRTPQKIDSYLYEQFWAFE